MKLAHFLGVALGLAPLGGYAQSSVPVPQSSGVITMVQIGPDGQTTTLTAVQPPSSCPVVFQAKHLADGDMVKTGASHPKGPGQRLTLSFTSPDSRTIASATVNVHGWDHAAVAETSAGSVTAVRSLTVRFPGVQGRMASADVWVPGLNSVTAIDLLTVAFTDGSTWNPTPGRACQIAPDPFMLVSQ